MSAPVPGRPLVRASVAVTAVFALAAGAAAVAPERLGTPVAVLDLVLFALGLAAFGAGLLTAAVRSRTSELSVSGLFLLSGSAPAGVRRALLGSLAAQVVVAVVTAAARPFTPLAFGVLVPTLGLAVCGLWAARHGTFPPRRVAHPPPRSPSGAQRPSGTQGPSTAPPPVPPPAPRARPAPPGRPRARTGRRPR